ncbi:MAG: hypothetical protein RMJ36_02205 [Candidatus Calescibacterium sp.]|nr:hypothetical protein [Candidatus Calescibacterium sp.]MDW8132452.1 hypothetical protein [Candidatus Calescibacterium sp.]
MLQIISAEIEQHRLRFLRGFIITLLLSFLVTFLTLFFIFFIIFFTTGREIFDKKAKEILFNNIKLIKHFQHEIKIYGYTNYEKDFYDFCRTIWSFNNMDQQKLEIMMNNKPIIIAEVKLTETYKTSKGTRTSTVFNGTIIKLKSKLKSKVLPFQKYKILDYRGETYIIVYKPQKIIQFDTLKKVSKEYLETKMINFINVLSYLIE